MPSDRRRDTRRYRSSTHARTRHGPQSSTEEFDGAPVHLPPLRFQAVDVPFDWTVAPAPR